MVMEEARETSVITCLTPNDLLQSSNVLVAQPESEIQPPKRRKTLGRQKIEIKKITVESKRQVAFSKRRTGLFKKAAELSVLSGAKLAIIVFSLCGKIYTFGPVDTMIDNYLHKTPVRLDDTAAEEEAMRPWWERPVASVPEEELGVYVAGLSKLRENLWKRIVEMGNNQADEIVPPWKQPMDNNQSLIKNITYGSRSCPNG